jgi:L-glutamine-phosphate cytidylyltransferase
VKVALLAAGLGSRLGTLTVELPKALVPVGDRTLLAHALAFAARLAPAEVVVVGGFGFPLVAAEIDRLRRADAATAALDSLTLLENREFRQGNLLSLETARPHLDDDFLLLNVDHIFRPSIAALVLPPPAGVTAFIDTDRILGDDDMKVKRDAQGRIARIAKTLTDFDAGYVGMTRVPATSLERYFSEMEAARASEGPAIHVERLLARLAEAGDPPLCREISGHGWLEVDTPTERDAAETALKQGGWM